jgi:hypothetical protein
MWSTLAIPATSAISSLAGQITPIRVADYACQLAFNPLVSKYTYRFQTRMAAADDVVFLNWGYESRRLETADVLRTS